MSKVLLPIHSVTFSCREEGVTRSFLQKALHESFLEHILPLNWVDEKGILGHRSVSSIEEPLKLLVHLNVKEAEMLLHMPSTSSGAIEWFNGVLPVYEEDGSSHDHIIIDDGHLCFRRLRREARVRTTSPMAV